MIVNMYTTVLYLLIVLVKRNQISAANSIYENNLHRIIG